MQSKATLSELNFIECMGALLLSCCLCSCNTFKKPGCCTPRTCILLVTSGGSRGMALVSVQTCVLPGGSCGMAVGSFSTPT